jgi:hypothetical protein
MGMMRLLHPTGATLKYQRFSVSFTVVFKILLQQIKRFDGGMLFD